MGGYEQYLALRGYAPGSSKAEVLRRALITSWREPGFHRFWQVWNPGIGHLLFCLYLRLGGGRHRLPATLLTFLVCGLVHDVAVILLFRRPFLVFTAAFTSFGVLSLVSRGLARAAHRERWPAAANVLLNLACVAVPLLAAVQLQLAVFGH